MEDLKEHIGLILTVSGTLFSGLMVCIMYIVNSFKDEMKDDREARKEMMKGFETKIDKVEGLLQRVTDELFDRVNIVEKSVAELWGQHRATHNKER